MTKGARIGGSLRLKGIQKTYGPVRAVDGVDLEVARGEFVTILGPSGSGKTTLLKIVAGFEQADAGAVILQDTDITNLPPARRNVGMVFQNYALFPHMTVWENVAFPLQMRRQPKPVIADRVENALRLVELPEYAERLPRQLSGGQQQRVALARALVFEPLLLLLDEPFGALDRKLRETMQLEVRRLQRKLGITTLFITHDQEEALILSDRIAILNRGRVEQVGRPEELYETPKTPFVADFLGESNLWPATVIHGSGDTCTVEVARGLQLLAKGQFSAGDEVLAMVRPERFVPGIEGGPNRFSGTVIETVYVGSSHRLRVALAGELEAVVRLPRASFRRTTSASALTICVSPEDVHLIPRPPAGS